MKEWYQDKNETSKDDMSVVVFSDEEGNPISFEVLAQAPLDGKEFLLVTDPEEGLSYILEACGTQEDSVTYRMVDSDEELRRLGELFADILEDVDFEYEM